MSRLPIAMFALALALADASFAQSSGSPTNQSAEEIVIKEKLKDIGVTRLKQLTRNRDGTWEGRGTKDQTEVAVVVDTSGNVIFH